jgi:hypothetical protein
MKKSKHNAEKSPIFHGGTRVPQFDWDRDILSTKETSNETLMAQARPELQVQRHPAAQLNRHQHGVWV